MKNNDIDEMLGIINKSKQKEYIENESLPINKNGMIEWSNKDKDSGSKLKFDSFKDNKHNPLNIQLQNLTGIIDDEDKPDMTKPPGQRYDHDEPNWYIEYKQKEKEEKERNKNGI